MQSNSNRASLLSNLRTGGVRSASQPSIVPHTAALGGSFTMPRLTSFSEQPSQYSDEEVDEFADMVSYGPQFNSGNHRAMPATAGPLDTPGNRFQQQQQAAFLQHMATQRSAANGVGLPALPTMDPMQMQLMQFELMKLQALQQAQQQYQAELLVQNQRQQQIQQLQRAPPSRRQSLYAEPATAGPAQTTFGSAQFARNQSDGFVHDLDGPKTAALGGKFGGRPVLSALNPNATVFSMNLGDQPSTPKTATPGNPSRTTVISGGTSLGGVSTPVHNNASVTPSKSDSAMSWRRASGVGQSPATPTRASGPASPALRLTPSMDELAAPSPLRQRPSPLRFKDSDPSYADVGQDFDSDNYVSNMVQLATSASTSDGEKDSSPGTPPSAGSNNSVTREEASKRLYEGLGMGRPVQVHVPAVQVKQPVAQVLRQPRGPPSSVDELGPRNFAARMQKKLVMAA